MRIALVIGNLTSLLLPQPLMFGYQLICSAFHLSGIHLSSVFSRQWKTDLAPPRRKSQEKIIESHLVVARIWGSRIRANLFHISGSRKWCKANFSPAQHSFCMQEHLDRNEICFRHKYLVDLQGINKDLWWICRRKTTFQSSIFKKLNLLK